MRATIQLCTYNRPVLLERVLDACLEQTIDPREYEVVVVDDGSPDGLTPGVIERASQRAACGFTALRQPNSGLASGRNNGIAHARGERIIFIDDDVLPLPNFVEEHLRSHAQRPLAIVRGAAITVENFDELPPPIWTIKDYSGNFFWTTNVSVPLATIRAVGAFDESFAEYGWEDIDVGLRLRFGGVKAVFNKAAVVYHYKPPLRTSNVEPMLRQARAQARTAVQLARLHPHWRTYLATGDNAPSRLLHKWLRGVDMARHYRSAIGDLSVDRPLNKRQEQAARRLRTAEYFEELERARARGA